jgi:dienelactone hydrolase
MPLLAPGQVLKEVQTFLEPRFIKPPVATDRASWEREAQRVRRDMLEQVVVRSAAAAWRDAKCGVVWLDTIEGGAGYHIRKFRYEALPGMWIPGLLYLPDDLRGDVPVAINVNGHSAAGNATDYKQLRAINLAKRGMLSLSLEWFGMGQLRTSGFAHGRMNQLDLCGASGLAPFYLALSRAIDVGLSLEHADKDRVLVTGLSGGGWQTILISSLDERVTLANPVAGYGSFFTNLAFGDMGDSEQAPTDMAMVADYTHLTALRAPRPTLLTYNADDDCCFKSGHTLAPLLNTAEPIFALYGAQDQLRSHVNRNPGTHNFEQENREQLYAAIGDYFYPGDAAFRRTEIPSSGELKTAEQLLVPLPTDNIDFHRLAESLTAALPREPDLPTDAEKAKTWQNQQRERLKALLRVPNYEVTDEQFERIPDVTEQPSAIVAACRIEIGNQWTVPVTSIMPLTKQVPDTVVLVADSGRASLAERAERLAAEGHRVMAVDPLFIGASRVKAQDPDYTYPLLMSAVGERPLGIQAAQLVAIARWARKEKVYGPVTLAASGPRASLAALVAAAIDPEAIDRVELTDSLASLKQLIEDDKPVENLPEMFAFGLLAEFDIRQLVAMAAPRRVVFRRPSERARLELQPLSAWYELFDAEFELAH